MSLKKKKGSSLIAVMMIFAVLSISGLSILSLTVSDYNLRITASKKTQSLYASDSGVNVVYGVMKKVIEQAIQKGNTTADTYMSEFNTSVSNYNGDPLKGEYWALYSADGSLNANSLKTQLNNEFQKAYKDAITGYITNGANYIESATDLNNNKVPLYDVNATSQPTITVIGKGTGFTGTPSQWKLNITSQFSTNPLNGQTSNKKTIQADIVISVPNYQDSYYVETNKQVVKYNPVLQNAISIDGDMYINSSITVNGNIFVKGTPPPIVTNEVYTKYNGGISIGSDDTNPIAAVFSNNVVTSNSFNISGRGKTVNVGGNIYAGNVYIGSSSSSIATDKNKFTADHCTLNVKATSGDNGMVYTGNDLALSATNSQINIDKYYGVCDMNSTRAGDIRSNSSSSIIVNTPDIGNGSSIIIGDAIINGTAYINTATPYQTGESVSIKGNYNAYTIPIPSGTGTLYDEDKVEFVDNDPLQLVNNFKIPDPVTHIKGNLTGTDKANYFSQIDTLNPATLKRSGITIKTLIFSAGMSLNDKQQFVTTGADNSGIVIQKQNDFATMVYEMGDAKHLGVPPSYFSGGTTQNDIATLNDDYLQGNVYKDVFGEASLPAKAINYHANTIAQVNSIASDRNVVDNTNSEVEEVVNKDVILLGAGYDTGSYNPASPGTDQIIIDLTKMNAPHGIIITKQNVILSGAVNFTGTIIAGGNLTADTYGSKTLTYDENYVMKTIGRNYIPFYSNVFNQATTTGTQTVEVSATAGKNPNGTSTAIDGGIVKLSNWRVNN